MNKKNIIALLFAAMASVQSAHADMNTDAVLLQQLARVRQATARYHDVSQAEAAGYVDIGLFVSGQGWHYLNSSLIDATFDLENPEILVYAPTPNGGRRLVAVEYAVPDRFNSNREGPRSGGFAHGTPNTASTPGDR